MTYQEPITVLKSTRPITMSFKSRYASERAQASRQTARKAPWRPLEGHQCHLLQPQWGLRAVSLELRRTAQPLSCWSIAEPGYTRKANQWEVSRHSVREEELGDVLRAEIKPLIIYQRMSLRSLAVLAQQINVDVKLAIFQPLSVSTPHKVELKFRKISRWLNGVDTYLIGGRRWITDKIWFDMTLIHGTLHPGGNSADDKSSRWPLSKLEAPKASLRNAL